MTDIRDTFRYAYKIAVEAKNSGNDLSKDIKKKAWKYYYTNTKPIIRAMDYQDKKAIRESFMTGFELGIQSEEDR